MLPTLELSLTTRNATALQPLLRRFEEEERVRVQVRLSASWDSAWSELVKIALYGEGPDLSEIGSTWVGDLAGMAALHPLSPGDVAALGGSEAFLPIAWAGGIPVGVSQVVAVPWLAGARVLYYRPALLERAGVNPAHAFDSIERLSHTLHQLHLHPVTTPWVVPTTRTHTTLLNVASWVWAKGGDFLGTDGREILFTRPEAVAGLRAYFALAARLAPHVQHLNGLQAESHFFWHEAAVTVGGPWMFNGYYASPQMAQIAAAPLPGVPFVGGSYLGIWKHSRRKEEALKLVRFLTRPDVQTAFGQQVGLLPTRLAALEQPPFTTEPFWQVAAEGLYRGRAFPVARLWGMVEDRITDLFCQLWRDLLAEPTANLDLLLKQHLAHLAHRLELALNR